MDQLSTVRFWKPESFNKAAEQHIDHRVRWRNFSSGMAKRLHSLGLPHWKIQHGLFNHLESDLIDYFLNYLTSSGDIDTLRRLLVADPRLKKRVVNVIDDLDSPWYLPDMDPINVRGVPRITLSKFMILHPTDDLKTRPVRIFTIRNCGVGSLPKVFSDFKNCDILQYLTKNTPVIMKTFARDSIAVKRIEKWSKSLPVKFPLIFIQDPDNCYTMFDLSQSHNRNIPIEPPQDLSFREPFAAVKFETDVTFIYKMREIHNIADCGYFNLPADRTDILSLSFTDSCTFRDELPCCSQRFRVPFTALMSRKLIVAFEGPRFPTLEINFNFRIMEKRSYMPSVVHLMNINWSESNPFGVTCEHARDQGMDASQWCVDPLYVPPITFTHVRREWTYTVEYTGLPDGALRLLDFSFVRKFTWRRMSPTEPPQTRTTLKARCMKILKLFTLVREGERLPTLECKRLEELSLVALENSVGGFDLNSLFDGAVPQKLDMMEITGPQLAIMSPDLSIVSGVVKTLQIRGYIPQFVIDPSCDQGFPRLKNLMVDISQIPTVSPLLHLNLKDDRFPLLEELNLCCSWKFRWRFDGKEGMGVNVNLELPGSCKRVCISSAAQIKIMTINSVQYPCQVVRSYDNAEMAWVKGDDGLFEYTGIRACLPCTFSLP